MVQRAECHQIARRDQPRAVAGRASWHCARLRRLLAQWPDGPCDPLAISWPSSCTPPATEKRTVSSCAGHFGRPARHRSASRTEKQKQISDLGARRPKKAYDPTPIPPNLNLKTQKRDPLRVHNFFAGGLIRACSAILCRRKPSVK